MNLESDGVVTEGGGPASTGGGSSPADEGKSFEVNWDDYATETDELAEDTFVEGDAEVVAPASEPAPPTPSPTQAANTAATPGTPGAAPLAAASTPSPAVATESPTTPVSVAPVAPVAPEAPVNYATWRADQVTKLEDVYKLSDDLAAQLLTEPEVVLPKLAASLHMAVTEAVLHSVNNSLPSVLSSIQATQSVEQKALEMFSGINPDLTDPKYFDSILKVGTMYRQVNPNATPEEAAKTVGNMVRTALGLPALVATAPAAAPAQPAIPVPRGPAPFVPSRGGGGGVVSSAPSNPWEMLAQDFVDD